MCIRDRAVLGSRASLFTSLVLLAVAIVVELVVLTLYHFRRLVRDMSAADAPFLRV